MRTILLLALLFISCDTDNCDLSEYPSSPLSEPYAVKYGDDWVSHTATFIVSNNVNNPNNQVILTATYSDDPDIQNFIQ